MEFAGVASAASPEGLGRMATIVRAALDRDEDKESIVDGLTASGWDLSFAKWYVEQAALSSDKLHMEVVFAAYPRGSTNCKLRESQKDLETIAGAYRILNCSGLCFAASLCVLLSMPFASARDFPMMAAVALFYATYVAAIVIAIVARAKAASPLGLNRAGTIAFGIVVGLIPCGSLLLLASLSGLLNNYMKRAGVKVGLLGPNADSLRAAMILRSSAPAGQFFTAPPTAGGK